MDATDLLRSVELVLPSPDFEQQWWALAEEFARGGETLIHGSAYRPEEREDLRRPGGFEAWTEHLLRQADRGPHLAEGRVPSSYRWISSDGALVGTIAVRHGLNDALRAVGGHIGYSVRPSARRRGVATEALRHGLLLASRRGVGSALITCDDANVASARTIERCGGVLEDVVEGQRRYWVDTTTVADAHAEGMARRASDGSFRAVGDS